MSKTPTPNEARAALQRLRENVANDDLIAALDVAIDHLPKPMLADGPYLYQSEVGARQVRFVKGGVSYLHVDDTLEPHGLLSGIEVTNPEMYEPIILIRGGSDVDPHLVRRVADRAHMPLSSVRTVLNALIQEALG